MSTTTAGVQVVDVPMGYCNALLNGAECVVVHDPGELRWEDGLWRGSDGVTVLLLSGPHAGREWQFGRAHLRPAPAEQAAPGTHDVP